MKAIHLTLRLFLIQALWNYRTLLGAGLAWAILPFLRESGGDDPEREEALVRDAAGTFNAHPYLAGFAVGALVRMQAEGAPREERSRFLDAIRGPLGSLGDGFFWTAWLPGCILFAALGGLLGLSPLAAVSAFLLLYNALHLAVRYRSALAGLEFGRGVGNALRAMHLQLWRERVGAVWVLFVGMISGWLLAFGVHEAQGWVAPAILLFGVGLLRSRLRWWAASALTPAVVLLLLLGGAVS